ncbi:hypothetical protein ACFVUS_34820 [Nocardia sp. NPDC058058]|uniref:hypothetical protein n=1 Tax=Nocardia sp. NPDC058058 TaxID=3346317 RepID=UPI0036D9EAFA
MAGTEFRVGSMPAVGSGCDTILMIAYLVHDRYGGRPPRGRAQVIENLSGDSLPYLILVTPPYPPVLEAVSDEAAAGEDVFEMFTRCFDAVSEFHESIGGTLIERLLVLVSALTLDGVPHAVVARSFRRAFEGSIRCG